MSDRAAAVYEISLVPMVQTKRQNVALHVVAGAIVLIWAAVAIVTGGLSGLVGLHEVIVTERETGRVVAKGGTPAFEGKRLVSVMAADAGSMTAEEFLQKWSDSSLWALEIQNSKGGK